MKRKAAEEAWNVFLQAEGRGASAPSAWGESGGVMMRFFTLGGRRWSFVVHFDAFGNVTSFAHGGGGLWGGV